MSNTDKYTENRYCENTIIENSKEYKLEKIWRSKKTDYTRDSKGELLPYPREHAGYWPDKQDILNRLISFDSYLDAKKKTIHYDESKNCLICGKHNITTKRYIYIDITWENGLVHYIKEHNIEPSTQFKQFILDKKITRKLHIMYRNNNKSDISANSTTKLKTKSRSKTNSKTKSRSKTKTKSTTNSKSNSKSKSNLVLGRVIKNDKEYVMIERNQMLILDALMIHGGYAKKYIDLEQNFSRYSEHAGFLDFEADNLSKIIVSGKTNRIDEGDEEIYLPMGMDDMFEYEYIFHTHPPTPKPGGRAKDGILYEFPSIGDIYHFIDHHNEGNVIGSLVVTAEGLYNIRKAINGVDDIKIDDDDLYKKYQRVFNKIQKDAISEYGTDFNTKIFYSIIAQDASFIGKMNQILNDFDIHIDYYPRKKDASGRWIIDTVFLVFRENKIK